MPDHLREAVDTLGYYRDDAFASLLALYQARWPKGLSATMFRQVEIAPLLSEKGKADPRHAQKATTLRMLSNLWRQEFNDTEPQWSTYCSSVKFAARALPEYHCDRALQLNGTVIDRSERWPLPLPDCGKEWCPCRWDQVPDEL